MYAIYSNGAVCLVCIDPFSIHCRKLTEKENTKISQKISGLRLQKTFWCSVYCKYYEVVYILFHTGMRISEFCGLTLKDIDLENRIINIDHQLLRTSEMKYVIEATKTNAGTRKLPMTEDVFCCFQAIIEDREKTRFEKMVDGHTGFLFTDKDGMPLVAMHWEHRFNNMVKRYNDIFRVQMPNITPHVCRHTYCSNMAKSGINPKTLQYLMGYSDIGVTLNTYTHLGLEDAAEELKRVEELADARKELCAIISMANLDLLNWVSMLALRIGSLRGG